MMAFAFTLIWRINKLQNMCWGCKINGNVIENCNKFKCNIQIAKAAVI